MSPSYSSYAMPEAVQPLSTADELESNVHRAHVSSNRKAAKVLGVTIVCAPRVAVDRKASQVLGTPVFRTDWETFACRPSASEFLHGLDPSPAKNKKQSFSRAKWFEMSAIARSRGVGSKDRRITQRARKVIIPWVTSSSKTQLGRRHTLSCDSGVELMLPGSNPKEWPDNPTSPSHPSDDASSNAPSSPAPNSISFLTPLLTPFSLNPVDKRKNQMVRSATKSVQLLGDEVSNVIKNHMERENIGRIGWDD